MKLSKNFSLGEFTKSAGIVITPTEQQIHCISVLAKDVLQPIRNKFGYTHINSGLRNEESYEKLKERGYSVSATSDHFAWSKINPKGVGAADIVCPSFDMKDVFEWIIKKLDKHFRQVIYYPDNGFVHVANNFNKIFTMKDPMPDWNRKLIKLPQGFVPYVH